MKITAVEELVANLAANLTEQNSKVINYKKQTMEVPLSVIEQLHKMSQEVLGDFKTVQT